MERCLDPLSRIVIPKEILRGWGIRGEDKPLMCIDDHITHLRVYPKIAKCVFCGVLLPPPYTWESMHHYKGRPVCPDCLGEIVDSVHRVKGGDGLFLPTWVAPKRENPQTPRLLNE